MAKLNPLPLILAGAAIFAWREGLFDAIFAPAPPRQEPPRPAAPSYTVADPASAAILGAAQIGGALLANVDDRNSAIRRGGRKLDKARREVFHAIGIGSDPKRKEKAKRQIQAFEAQHLRDLEAFAARVHHVASRHDVREWVIDSPRTGHVLDPNTGLRSLQHRISIYFQRQKDPYVILVPRTSLGSENMAAAWIAEPIARATGGWTQRGGRLANGAPFIYYVDEETGARVPAYSDTNPFAPPHLTASAQFLTKGATRPGSVAGE